MKKLEEALRKEEQDKRITAEQRDRAELEELKRSMESEISSLQNAHRRRMDELHEKHREELLQVCVSICVRVEVLPEEHSQTNHSVSVVFCESLYSSFTPFIPILYPFLQQRMAFRLLNRCFCQTTR